MARRRLASPVLAVPLLLAGCGGWTRAEKPSGGFASDNAECEQLAIEKVAASHQKHDAPKWVNRSVGTKSYTLDGDTSLRNK